VRLAITITIVITVAITSASAITNANAITVGITVAITVAITIASTGAFASTSTITITVAVTIAFAVAVGSSTAVRGYSWVGERLRLRLFQVLRLRLLCRRCGEAWAGLDPRWDIQQPREQLLCLWQGPAVAITIVITVASTSAFANALTFCQLRANA